jgi:[acyl-carrier-protein] S-malonyltransferase
MKIAYLFPGQGSQFPGMGRSLFETYPAAKARFDEADGILDLGISRIMFEGTEEDLRKTSVTQPAIFLHSVILAEVLDIKTNAAMVAGHSLGEFSALTAAGALSFADGLRLVAARATAMQEACDAQPSAMAAIVGLEDAAVESVCAELAPQVVVPANYNSPGQLVISGTVEAVNAAIELAKARGAKIAKLLPVNGAFHSPLMEPARAKLAAAIEATPLHAPICPVYQNVNAEPATDPATIKANLIAQLTGAVRWTQTIQHMVADGATEAIELGPGTVLSGLSKRIDKTLVTSSRAE